MNRLRPNHKMAMGPGLAGALALVAALAALSLVCRTPAADAPRVGAEVAPRSDAPDVVQNHCLMYGKYCLTGLLRSR
ncbi:hypothetical protein ACV229_07460 [Burkholderia sp. MR1-5-21]